MFKTESFGHLDLDVGIYLEFGFWDLEFPCCLQLYSKENHLVLFPLSEDYPRLQGTFLCITNPFAMVAPRYARCSKLKVKSAK